MLRRILETHGCDKVDVQTGIARYAWILTHGILDAKSTMRYLRSTFSHKGVPQSHAMAAHRIFQSQIVLDVFRGYVLQDGIEPSETLIKGEYPVVGVSHTLAPDGGIDLHAESDRLEQLVGDIQVDVNHLIGQLKAWSPDPAAKKFRLKIYHGLSNQVLALIGVVEKLEGLQESMPSMNVESRPELALVETMLNAVGQLYRVCMLLVENSLIRLKFQDHVGSTSWDYGLKEKTNGRSAETIAASSNA